MENDFLKHVDYPINDDPLWKVFEENYGKYYLNFEGEKVQRIPKKIHQVWIGSELPLKYFRLIRTWIDKHPDWEYKLWTDKDVKDFGMVNQKLFDAIENKGLKSDIFRYEIIYRYGGLYLDTDFKCIKPMDDLLHLDFFTGNAYTAYPYVNCGLFATYPENPLLKRVIDELTPKIDTLPTPGQYGEIMAIMGADFFARMVLDYMRDTKEKAVVFPKDYFYPFPPEGRDDVDIQKNRDLSKTASYVKDVTYCVHLWFTSWQWQTQIIEEGDILPPDMPQSFTPQRRPAPPQKGGDARTAEATLSSFLRNLGNR